MRITDGKGDDIDDRVDCSHLVEVNGDSASGHWYLQEFTRDLQGERFAAMSRYTDEYTRIKGQWLFQTRRYDFIYRGPADLGGEYTALPA